jgi:FlaA1/EpsC-like NDP-sugar epimerase
MLEDQIGAALRNNVLGTQVVAKAASQHGCERFVLISTDKAVNPSNVMGASKRLAEQMILLSGKRPGLDLQIVYTGLRPGEKAV